MSLPLPNLTALALIALQRRRRNILRKDPTRSLALRTAFARQMTKRFRELKGVINKSIVENDAFGLKATTGRQQFESLALDPLAPQAFQFARDERKVEGFMEWLKEQEEKGILEIEVKPGPRRISQPWSNTFIQSSYQKGMIQARSNLRRAGVEQLPSFRGDEGKRFLDAAFNQPFHADRVGLIFTRSFNELEGITQAMDQQISRVLARGLAEGRGPLQIAKLINDRVDKIGLTRAKLLARTETIETLNTAALNEFEFAEGVIDEEVLVLWDTAGDERVRATHIERDGRVFTKEVARILIGEPNCRCALLPFVESIEEKPTKPIVRKEKKIPRKQVKAPKKKPVAREAEVSRIESIPIQANGKTLTEKDERLIGRYTSLDYVEINEAQLGKPISPFSDRSRKEFLRQAAQTEAALLKLPGKEVKSWRGLKFTNKQEKEKFLKSFETDTVHEFKAFQSSSRRKAVAESYMGVHPATEKILVEIDGKSGRDVKAFSRNKNEDEILFLKGAKFEVTNVSENLVKLKEI